VLGTFPTAILPDEILTPGDGQVRALVVVAGNPLLSAPDSDRMRRALGELDTLVSLDLFVNDTAALGSHVLACTDFLEREDFPLAMLQLMPEPYVSWTDAVVPARGERRPEWRILMDLARAVGVPLFGSRAADLALRATLRSLGPAGLAEPLLWPAFGPLALRELRRHPHGMLVSRERPGDFLARRIGTPSGKVELYPRLVWSRLAELEEELERASTAPATSLRLFTKRERLGHNSWMHANGRTHESRRRRAPRRKRRRARPALDG
jgi:formate dehydrogenase